MEMDVETCSRGPCFELIARTFPDLGTPPEVTSIIAAPSQGQDIIVYAFTLPRDQQVAGHDRFGPITKGHRVKAAPAASEDHGA